MEQDLMYRKHNFPTHSDDRGSLTVFDQIDLAVGWQVKRSYWITDVKSARGGHCVKGEKKFYIMAQGSCTMRIFDGKQWYEEQLEGPGQGIEFFGDLWREVDHFSPGAVMFTLCNGHHVPELYIRDLEEYKIYVKDITKK